MFGLSVRKPADGKLADAIRAEIINRKLKCVQIFTHGPRGKQPINLDYDALSKLPVDIYVHGAYVTAGVWSHLSYIRHIAKNLEVCQRIGAKGFIIHLPKQPPRQVADTMRHISKKIKSTVPILLEISAMRSDANTYETPEKINALCDAMPNMNWGICIDTAHLWAAGIDLSIDMSWTRWFHALSPAAVARVKLIHLNGAQAVNFATGNDRHMVPLSADDAIWGKLDHGDIERLRQSSLAHMIQDCKKKGIPMICEMHGTADESADLVTCLDILHLLS